MGVGSLKADPLFSIFTASRNTLSSSEGSRVTHFQRMDRIWQKGWVVTFVDSAYKKMWPPPFWPLTLLEPSLRGMQIALRRSSCGKDLATQGNRHAGVRGSVTEQDPLGPSWNTPPPLYPLLHLL